MPCTKWLCLALFALVASGSRADSAEQEDDDDDFAFRPSRTLPPDRDLFDWTSVPGRLSVSLNRSATLSASTTTSTSTSVGGRRFEYNLVISDPISGQQSTKRRCLICPSNSVVVTNLRCNCARMRKPLVRSCQESQSRRAAKDISSRVVQGPAPGSLLNEGVHPIVLWIYDRQSPSPVHVCRYTQTVVVKRCPPLSLSPWHLVNCSAGHRLNSRCRFRCQPGRHLRGSPYASCIKRPDGQIQWSHSPPVCSAVCPPAPSVPNGKISCSVESTTGLAVCKYVCDQGHVIPRSQRKFQPWSCSLDGRWNQTQTPRCARKERPVLLDQCADLNVTLDQSVTAQQLPVPSFRAADANSSAALSVTCDVNSVGSAGSFERRCSAVDSELDTSTTCQQRVHVSERKCRPLQAPANGDLKCSTKNNTAVCQVQCRQGHSLQLKGDDAPVPSADRAAYCHWNDGVWIMGRHRTPVMELECEPDPPAPKFEAQLHLGAGLESPCHDEQAVDTVQEALKSALIQRNSEVCREANCFQLDVTCRDNETLVDNARFAASLDVVWTVSADYTPIEDYYYEGVDVPEGESLIEKIQVETESTVRADLGFHRQMRSFGVHIQPHSYFVAKLDLVCQQAGYVVNEATNRCKKCPQNTFQERAKCSPCAEGTYQDLRGQTFCRPCNGSRLAPQSLSRFATCKSSALRSASPLSLRSQGQRGRAAARPAGYQAKKAAHLTLSKSKKATLATRALETDDAPCGADAPCQGGARCIRLGSQSKCLCPIGLTGPRCQKAFCPPLMCFHGGRCTVRSGKWHCLCRHEYSGDRCQHRRPLETPAKRQRSSTNNGVSLHPTMGFCASNPCANDGRCVDNSHAGYFTCLCAPPFLGPLCQYSPCTTGQRSRASCPSGSLCVTLPGQRAVSALCLCPTHVKHPKCSGQIPSTQQP